MDEASLEGSVPIGVPIANTQVYVLDASLEAVPVGVVGELYTSGDGLSRGYWDQVGLMAARFVANPYGSPGSRMYRTGDLARWRADGTLAFEGRVDDQVKLRGFRIELGEIESVLVSHESVSQAAVVLRDDGPSGQELVAYVVGSSESALETEGLSRLLGEQLPGYMVPSALIRLETLPLTPNGKLDRRSLPAPVRQVGVSRGPRTPKEQRLSEVFAEVLGLERVGVDESFFALGGDSIVSIQLVSRARQAGLVLSPRDVFEHQTVQALARVAEVLATERVLESPLERRIGRAPLTPIMHHLLSHPGPMAAFHQSMLIAVPEGLSESELIAGLQCLIDTHDALRLRLVRERAEFVIAPPGSVSMSERLIRVELGGLSLAEQQSRLQAAVEAVMGRLDPQAAEMVWAVWAPPNGGLLFLIHHLCGDGVSWRILVPDLMSAWTSLQRGESLSLPAVGTPFRQWAQGLVDAVASRMGELELWASILSRGEALLPGVVLDGERDTMSSALHLDVSLAEDLTEAVLTRIPQAYYGGVDEVLLSALVLSVQRWRQERGLGGGGGLLVDLEGHGREALCDGVDVSRTVGWFTSLYPLCLEIGGDGLEGPDAGLGEGLKRVKDHSRDQ